MGTVGDARQFDFYFRERSGRITRSGDQTFLVVTADGKLECTAGLRMYAGLLAAAPAAHGYEEPSLPTNLPVSDVAYRTLRAATAHKPCVVVDGNEETVFKIHSTPGSFDREKGVFDALAASAATPLPILKLQESSTDALWMSFQPYCKFTLRDAPFSDALFAKVCTTGSAVLSALWAKNIAYADPSPNNVLVDAQLDVYWNDFGLSCGLGERIEAFMGTPAFASTRLSACQDGNTINITKLDDMQGVFFTLLSFAWDDRTSEHPRRLPWEHEDEHKTVCDQKAGWVTTQFPCHIRPSQKPLFDALMPFCFPHAALSHDVLDQNASAFLKILAGAGSSVCVDDPDVGVARTRFHATQLNDCPVRKHGLRIMKQSAAEARMKAMCPVCFPGTACST